MEPTHEEVYKNHLIRICQDEDPESPREWDNMTTMVCFHSRYNLGDAHDFRKADYTSWEDVKKAIIREHGPCLISPLYLYDHSGISISMGDFGDRWDSCCVGFIFVPYAKIREEYSVKRISAQVMERARSCMESELKTYDDYLRGEVYGYKVYDSPEDDNEIESCWGYYGDYDHKEFGALREARRIVDDKTDIFRNALRTAAQKYDQQQKEELADKLDAALEHQKELVTV